MKDILSSLPNEIWKTMRKPYDNYQISNLGRCRRADNHRAIKPFLKKDNGYLYIKIGKKNFRFHREFAKLFVPNKHKLPFDLLVVNHIDGNKQNNRADNLEWVTPYENFVHAVKKHFIRCKLKKYDESLPIPFVYD